MDKIINKQLKIAANKNKKKKHYLKKKVFLNLKIDIKTINNKRNMIILCKIFKIDINLTRRNKEKYKMKILKNKLQLFINNSNFKKE
jgi:hypothetical protein